MNENDLKVVMDCIADPVKNVYRATTFVEKEEIRRIIRVLNISKEQGVNNSILALLSLSTIKIVLSNN